MPTAFQIGQLLMAGGIPLSLFVVMNQIRDVQWTRLAPAVVVTGLLAIGLLVSESVVPPLGAAFIMMLLLGHMTTFLDDD